MNHKNSHTHNYDEHIHHTRKALIIAFWLNLAFSVFEAIGGLYTNSTAIVADAFHDFMDAGAIGIAILLERLSDKKRTGQFSYGFKRFSLLSALGLSVFLITGAIIMLVAAIKSFIVPSEVHSTGMLILAIIGLAVNAFAFVKVKGGHGHHHHTHNHNSESIMLHLLEDVLGWAAVLVGAIIMYFTQWFWIDGVLTIAIALYVGYNATKNLINTSKIMLQSVPEQVNLSQLQADLELIEGVLGVHDIHAWSLDGNYNVGSVHIVVADNATQSEKQFMHTVYAVLKKHAIHHPTVQIEIQGMDCKLHDC